jgi:hypothetical protein
MQLLLPLLKGWREREKKEPSSKPLSLLHDLCSGKEGTSQLSNCPNAT